MEQNEKDRNIELATTIDALMTDLKEQKQLNEEHQKINGELRIKVKELEKLLEEKTLRIGFENSDDYVSKDKIKEKMNFFLKEVDFGIDLVTLSTIITCISESLLEE